MRIWLVCLLVELFECFFSPTTRTTFALDRAHFLSDDDTRPYSLSSVRTDRVRKPSIRTISTNISSEVNAHSSKTQAVVGRRRPSRVEGRHSTGKTTTNQHRSFCSPAVYMVSLQNGYCVRRVKTTMCYGKCTSYSHPVRKILRPATDRMDVERVCNCCSPLGVVSVKRYKLTCAIDGRSISKTFYVPKVDRCKCRPCSR